MRYINLHVNRCSGAAETIVVVFRSSDYDFSYDEASPSPQPYGTTPNPATPGYGSETPPSNGPYTPATPGSSSGMYGSESTYSPYQPTPSPGNYQRKFIYF